MTSSEAIQIQRPFEDVADLLASRPADWIEPFLRIAVHSGEAAAGRSVEAAPQPGSRHLAVELLPAVPGTDQSELLVPLRWRTGGFHWVPPSYAGRIVLRRVSFDACEMVLEGSYALPGSARDRSGADATSVAAAATVATFLRSFRAAVEEQARESV
jgi:hypothetical protein